MRRPENTQTIRQGVLAVSVMEDIDLEVRDDGVVLPAGQAIGLRWSQLAAACGGFDPTSESGRRRLGGLLRLSRLIGDLGSNAESYLFEHAIAMALTPGHVDHLGHTWLQGRLPGGALDLGIGLRDVTPGVETESCATRVVPLPAIVLHASGISARALWTAAMERSERMSVLALAMIRDGATTLRAIGGCDVPSLLISERLREAIAEGDGTGMRAVAVPDRNRGWFDLARIDPAYVNVAYHLTDEPERGLDRPVLLTRHEILMPRSPGNLTRHAVEGH